MILAAGRGERMGELTSALPKPLLSLGGETLIERQLRLLALAGIDEVIVNLSYRGAQIRERVGAGAAFGLEVRYSQEPEPPLETAGAIVAALPLLGQEPFLLINADVVSDFDYRCLLSGSGPVIGAGVDTAAGLGTLVLVPNPAHNSDGDFGIDADGQLCRQAPLFTFSGISVLWPQLFAGLAPGRRPLIEVLNSGIDRRQLKGLLHQGQWIDVGTPARLAEARALLGD